MPAHSDTVRPRAEYPLEFGSPTGLRGYRRVRLLWAALLLLLGAGTAAQDFATDEFVIGTAQGREVVVVPTGTASMRTESEFGPIFARSFETTSGRVHVVSFQGETFRAATPMEGPMSRIVFDPAQRKFVALLPSIRVELDSESSLDIIVEILGAIEATRFDNLGFAIIDLPDTLHPAMAIDMLASLPEQPRASLRLRGPQIQWR